MISVIIPTYNRANVIARSIKSVLNQTYKDIEILIIDDNSLDDTKDVVSKFNDSRLKYIKLDTNKGACFARNFGIEISNGEYIAFQDSDDVWLPNKLEKQIQYLLENDLDLVSCQLKINKVNGYNIFPKDASVNTNEIYFQNCVSTQAIMVKKQCFNEVKFDETLPRFQDWDFILEIIKKNHNIGIVEEVLVEVFFQENSISMDAKKALAALEIFLEKHGKDNHVKAHFLRLMGVYKLQNGDNCKVEFRKSFLLNPFNKKIVVDLLLSHLNLRRLHYQIYKKKGRFK